MLRALFTVLLLTFSLHLHAAEQAIVTPPGAVDPIHRHGARASIYGRNASATKPARFIVILVKKQGADVVLPAG
jgi:hypothetical protein